MCLCIKCHSLGLTPQGPVPRGNGLALGSNSDSRKALGQQHDCTQPPACVCIVWTCMCVYTCMCLC